MNARFCRNAIIKHDKPIGKTIFLQVYQSQANKTVPKTIQWKDIEVPKKWVLSSKIVPRIPVEERREVDHNA